MIPLPPAILPGKSPGGVVQIGYLGGQVVFEDPLTLATAIPMALRRMQEYAGKQDQLVVALYDGDDGRLVQVRMRRSTL